MSLRNVFTAPAPPTTPMLRAPLTRAAGTPRATVLQFDATGRPMGLVTSSDEEVEAVEAEERARRHERAAQEGRAEMRAWMKEQGMLDPPPPLPDVSSGLCGFPVAVWVAEHPVLLRCVKDPQHPERCGVDLPEPEPERVDVVESAPHTDLGEIEREVRDSLTPEADGGNSGGNVEVAATPPKPARKPTPRKRPRVEKVEVER